MPSVPDPDLERIPESIKLAVRAWPECKENGLKRHYAAADGLCYTCGVTSPCDYERWLSKIPDPRPAFLSSPEIRTTPHH